MGAGLELLYVGYHSHLLDQRFLSPASPHARPPVLPILTRYIDCSICVTPVVVTIRVGGSIPYNILYGVSLVVECGVLLYDMTA